MNRIFIPDDPAGVFQSIHLPDFDVTWAGPNPFGEGFCLGSEAGTLLFTDTQCRPLPTKLLGQASQSGEAISGVAFSQNWLAVTTRKDINLIRHQQLDGQGLQAVAISGGAPDVVVAPSGNFVIPLGQAGVMFLKPGMSVDDRVTIRNAEKHDLNFCRVVALEGEKDNDMIVFAGRRGGFGFSDFQNGVRGQILHSVNFEELDVVDVCSMAIPNQPLAIAAAARDGSLLLFRDIRTDKEPLSLKFADVKGTVYRILSARGDIYLLTSRGLFVLFQLADRVRQGVPLGKFTTNVLRIPIEAADANVVDQKWLLAVGADHLFTFDLDKMPKSPEENGMTQGASWGEPNAPEKLDVRPMWEQSGFQQISEHLAPAS